MFASRPSRRVRVLVFFSNRCERNALRRRSRPVPVTLIRLAAPRSVFILGMSLFPWCRCRVVATWRSVFGRPLGGGLGDLVLVGWLSHARLGLVAVVSGRLGG